MQKETNNIIDFPSDKKADWEVEWDRCKHWIEKAIKYQDSYTISDIEDKIRHGLFHLWPGQRSAMVTELVIYPQNKALNLLFCGGDYEELETMLPSIEVFAKQLGCKRLYGGGRPGWLRKIQHLGFEKEHLIRKEL
jgi:hypothetical protein|tara:strand:- start:3995 stop:4402 length:408 start_codon:yes stop_codon:yes gene_type:complete